MIIDSKGKNFQKRAGPGPSVCQSKEPVSKKPVGPPPGYLDASIHKFKNNISRYTRLLEAGIIRGVILSRGDQRVAAVIPLKPEDNSDQRLQARPQS
jgi:hypothetical protein